MRKPPEPPQGLTAVDPREWMRVWLRVIAPQSVKSVGMACAAFADYETGAEIHPGIPLLMKACGIGSNTTVVNSLAQMREWELVWCYAKGNARRGESDMYRLTFPDDILVRVPMLGPDWKPVENLPIKFTEHTRSGLNGHGSSVLRTLDDTSSSLVSKRHPYQVEPTT